MAALFLNFVSKFSTSATINDAIEFQPLSNKSPSYETQHRGPIFEILWLKIRRKSRITKLRWRITKYTKLFRRLYVNYRYHVYVTLSTLNYAEADNRQEVGLHEKIRWKCRMKFSSVSPRFFRKFIGYRYMYQVSSWLTVIKLNLHDWNRIDCYRCETVIIVTLLITSIYIY